MRRYMLRMLPACPIHICVWSSIHTYNIDIVCVLTTYSEWLIELKMIGTWIWRNFTVYSRTLYHIPGGQKCYKIWAGAAALYYFCLAAEQRQQLTNTTSREFISFFSLDCIVFFFPVYFSSAERCERCLSFVFPMAKSSLQQNDQHNKDHCRCAIEHKYTDSIQRIWCTCSHTRLPIDLH